MGEPLRPWRDSEAGQLEAGQLEAGPGELKAANLVRVVSEITPRNLDVGKGWDGVVARVAQPRSPWRRLRVLAALALAVMAGLVLHRFLPTAPVATLTPVTIAAAPEPMPFEPMPVTVNAWQGDDALDAPPLVEAVREPLKAESAAALAARAALAKELVVATANTQWRRTSDGVFLLDRGELAVAPREKATRILTPEVTLAASGARFLADVTVAGTQVQVFEGEVAVSAPHMKAVAMHAGETRLFASDDTGALDAPPPELLSEACTLLESLDDRLVCLNEESRGSGLRAQAALYERAWLQAENGQPDGAAATLLESIKRFPEGPLQAEARLALLRALLAGNRRSEAVQAARSFLSACPDDPRVPKVEAFVLALEWAGSR